VGNVVRQDCKQQSTEGLQQPHHLQSLYSYCAITTWLLHNHCIAIASPLHSYCSSPNIIQTSIISYLGRWHHIKSP